MARLFLSYAREDQTFVGTLAAALKGAGHEVWYDRDLGGGSFRDQIVAGLAQAEVVIVAWSARSKLSRYVLDEAEHAVSRGVLLPVRIDATTLPLGFGSLQTLDFSNWSGQPDTPAFKQLLDQVDLAAKNPAPAPVRPALRFVAKALVLATLLAAACTPLFILLNNAKRGVSGVTIADITEAFVLAFVCSTPVMLWCGHQVRRFGVSRTGPILRRAAAIYAVSALVAISIIAIAVAAGVTANLPPMRALAQLAFVGLFATLVIAAAIAVIRAVVYIIRRLAE